MIKNTRYLGLDVHAETITAKRNEQGETLEQENRRLRKDVERLRVERAILKKAAAFFAKESE